MSSDASFGGAEARIANTSSTKKAEVVENVLGPQIAVRPTSVTRTTATATPGSSAPTNKQTLAQYRNRRDHEDDSMAETDDADEANSSEAETVILEESRERTDKEGHSGKNRLSANELDNTQTHHPSQGESSNRHVNTLHKLSDSYKKPSVKMRISKPPLKRLQKRIHISDDDDEEYSGDRDDDDDQDVNRGSSAIRNNSSSDSDDWSNSRGRIKSRSHGNSRDSSINKDTTRTRIGISKSSRKFKDHSTLERTDNNHSRSLSPVVKRTGVSRSSSNIPAPIQPSRKDGSPIRDASGRLLLQKLCDKGDFERSKALIEIGVDVNDRDYAGNTALHDAALKGHLDIVELLLDNGAIIDIRSGMSDLDTPLIDATSRGHLEVVKVLLSRGADPRIFNAQGKTALDFLSSDDENFQIIENLLKEYAVKARNHKLRRGSDSTVGEDETGTVVSTVGNAYDAALHATPGTFPDAYFEGRKGSGGYSDGYSSGSGSHSVHRKHNYGNHHNHNHNHAPKNGNQTIASAAADAADYGDSGSLSHDESSKSSSHHNPSRRRGGARSQSIRNDLLWMDLTTKTGREQVYRRAADGDLQYVGRSLEEGWQPDADCLVLAAKHGHTEVVGLLLAFGVESDQLNDEGVTALHETVGRGHIDTIRLLLDSGADPCWLDHQGRSYLDLAKEALGSDDEETLLIEDAVSKKKRQNGVDSKQKRESSLGLKKTSAVSTTSAPSSSSTVKVKQDSSERRRKVSENGDVGDVSAENRRKINESDDVSSDRRRKVSESDDVSSGPDQRIKKRKLLQVKSDEPVKVKQEPSSSDEPIRNKPDQSSEFIHKQMEQDKAKEIERRNLLEQKEAERAAQQAAEKAAQQAREEEQRQMRLQEAETEKAREKERKRLEEEAEKAREAREAREYERRRVEEDKRKIQKEKERELARRREILAAQKEKERKERELQMLKSLEEEEKRKEEKRKHEEELEAKRQQQLNEEIERQRAIEAEQELERQRLLKIQREAELRKQFPYAIRMATYGAKNWEEIKNFLPLVSRSFSPDSSYFLDIQISLLLGLSNVHQTCK